MQNTYYIHNTTRSPHTRTVRKSQPGPDASTKNIFIGGGLIRLMRGRPSPITESFLRAHLRELADKDAKGLLAVYDSKSRRVNLLTLTPIEGTSPPVYEEPVTSVGVPHPSMPPVPEEPPVEAPPVEEVVTEEPPVEETAEAEQVEEAAESPVTGAEEEAPAAAANPFFGGNRKKNRR